MKNFLMLIGGIAIGAGVSWIYHKNKYEQMVQEEVESLRDHMKEKESKDKCKNSNDENTIVDKEEKEYDDSMARVHNLVREQHYTSSNNEDNEPNNPKKPFVVSPEDFASLPGYDTDTFYYHQDDIISNDNQEIVDDIEQILGLTVSEIKEQFGVYEDDAVYIRNERLKTDYEVLREESNYIRRNGD